MDMNQPRKRMLSDYHSKDVQLDKQLFNKTFSMIESEKYDSGVESSYASVPECQTDESSLSYETLGATTTDSNYNQPNHYQELNNDVWNDIFPDCKQSSSTQLQLTDHTSHQQITARNGGLISLACIAKYPASLDEKQIDNELTLIPHSSSNTATPHYDFVAKSFLTFVEPELVNEHRNTTTQLGSDPYKVPSGEKNEGYCGDENVLSTSASVRQNKYTYTAKDREEVYDWINDGDHLGVTDHLLIQCNARPLPNIPLHTGLEESVNSSAPKSICKKGIPLRVSVTIALFTLVVALLAAVVFLAVNFAKKNNETIGKR